VNFEAASHLERRFFLQTDNDASQALSKKWKSTPLRRWISDCEADGPGL